MKRLLAILLTISLLSGMLVFQVSAAEETGTCGDNLTWKTDKNILTISGTGPMYDFSEENPAPWMAKGSWIRYIDIQEGVTRIGDYAFAGSVGHTRTYVPASVTEVGSKAFYTTGNSGEIVFLGDAPIFAEDSFLNNSKTVTYYRDWAPTVLQNYGGSPAWRKGILTIDKTSKKLFALNDEITAADFYISAGSRLDNTANPYTAKNFLIGTYDTSTYGQKKVELNIDGQEFTYYYYVTDGQNHLDLINVELPTYVEYGSTPTPVVTAGDLTLKLGTDYRQDFAYTNSMGYTPQVTITGIGTYEGFEKTYHYAVTLKDISKATVTIEPVGFVGLEVTPTVQVVLNGKTLKKGTDYTLIYDNNVNVGTGTVRIIGKGNYYGSVVKEFSIVLEEKTVYLPGAYNGTTTGTLNEQIYYQEGILGPGKFTGRIDSGYKHTAYFELYRIEGETLVPITSKQSYQDYASNTSFSYDFSDLYYNNTESGETVYMLAYAWVDVFNEVYSGALVMHIPSRASNAKSMTISQAKDTSSYNKEYLDLSGEDGKVENASWTTSDDSIATVEDGVVTLKTPGTVTITAQAGTASASYQLVVEELDLTIASFFKYDAATETAHVLYRYMPLTAGVDYVSSAVVQGNVVEVTLTGTGLFTGQLVRQFDAQTGEAVGDVHRFDNSCDETCNVCYYTRVVAHDPAGAWKKNQTHHWRTCSICGQRATEAEEHIISAEDENLCTVCGTICLTGDADGDGEVTDWDGVMLARYLAGWNVEVDLAALDVDGDGEVTDWDGVIMDRYLAGWNVSIG